MKFTDGYWHMRRGVTAHFPAQAHDTDITADTLTVYAPTRLIRHRGDTLNLPLLTIHFSSPMSDVVRVEIVHHKGAPPRTPEFVLFPQEKTDIKVEDGADTAVFTTGKLSAKVKKGEAWGVEFVADGRKLTESGWRGMGMMDTADGRFIHEQLQLGVGECVYGLGERFTPFVKNGQVVDIWNEDGGTASEQSYKNIPFYLTNRGYGVFVNHPERVAFEVASEKVERVQFSVSGERLEYFLIYGPSPKEVLQKYTALTGRPALPPAWSFGLWLSTSFTTDYDEETVTSFIQGMEDRDIPLSVFHFDCFWMKEFHWSNFVWDGRLFPDPAAMLQRLKDRGLHISVWINPYIAQRSELFDEGIEKGYFVKRPNGDVWQWDMWQAGMALVDFTNPDACQWFADKLRALLEMGVDTLKTDFGERIPTDVVYHDGSEPQKMHNFYTYLYNKTVFEMVQDQRGAGEAVLFARSATAGCQQFPVHWGGDSTASFESMAESLRGGLSLTLSGFGYWSHDIGGFENRPSPDVYKRWCAFGLLSSHSRLHGSGSYRVPWLIDEEAVEVLRYFTKLKNSLMPYLWQTAVSTHKTGIPMMRAMILEFPNDPACDFLDRQYMLGDSLLVAPVLSEDGMVSYYVPNGRWTNFITGAVIEGPKWVQETHGMMSIPLLVRPNSVIAVGAEENRPDYDFSDNITLQLYQITEGEPVIVTIPSLTGTPKSSYQINRQENTITVHRQAETGQWQIQLMGVQTIKESNATRMEADRKGTIIVPDKNTDTLEIQLAETYHE